jgi:hypothetical protein
MPDDGAKRRVVLLDADGRPTDDPAAVVAGEVAELGDDGRPVRRTRFFLTREQLRWSPVDEPALLLWVLAGLVAVWAVVAVVLAAT